MGNATSAFFISAIIFIFIGGPLYLLPTIIASKKKHKYRTAIIVLNFLLGWTLLGWVAALVWSLTIPEEETNIIQEVDNKYENLERLQKLKESGAITEAEFETEKAKILK